MLAQYSKRGSTEYKSDVLAIVLHLSTGHLHIYIYVVVLSDRHGVMFIQSSHNTLLGSMKYLQSLINNLHPNLFIVFIINYLSQCIYLSLLTYLSILCFYLFTLAYLIYLSLCV